MQQERDSETFRALPEPVRVGGKSHRDEYVHNVSVVFGESLHVNTPKEDIPCKRQAESQPSVST